MTRINLLQRTKKKKKQTPASFRAVVSVLLLFGFLMALGYVWVFLNGTTTRLRAEKNKLSQKLEVLKVQLKEVENFERDKKAVVEKIDIIRQLQKNQTIPVRILVEISERLPERVWLTNITETSGVIDLEGKATGNGEIVEFINHLKASKFFTNIQILESRQVLEANTPIYTFKLKWSITA